MRTTIIALCLLLLPTAVSLRAAAASRANPNILIILSDDLGYADVGFQGSKEVATPHLDALAKSGVRCTSGYVTHPFCSPTRAGMLTGRYQQRFGHEYNPVYDPLDVTEGLPLNERLLPQFMKEAGYQTGWVGKWHLGSSPAHVPWRRGFDEAFGFIGGGHQYINWTPNGRQYTLPITRNGQAVAVREHLTGASATRHRLLSVGTQARLGCSTSPSTHRTVRTSRQPSVSEASRESSPPDAGNVWPRSVYSTTRLGSRCLHLPKADRPSARWSSSYPTTEVPSRWPRRTNRCVGPRARYMKVACEYRSW